MNKESKVLILGATGLVGSALVRKFKSLGYSTLLTPDKEELDLFSKEGVFKYFEENRPDYLIMAAAKVGGIHANNKYRADFIYENLLMECNVFGAAHEYKIKKFIFLGSSCIYPKLCEQPIKEEYLLNGLLEETNEPYAIAKIAGLKLAENFNRQYGDQFFSLMPTNLYGENDNFHPENSHVIPALIQRLDKAIKNNESEFEVWGTGKPMREFLYVDDLADACHFILDYSGELPYFLNVGTGVDVTIAELAETLADVMSFQGKVVFNTDYPDGTPRKLLDVSKIQKLGWKHKIELKEGLQKTVEYYKNAENIRAY